MSKNTVIYNVLVFGLAIAIESSLINDVIFRNSCFQLYCDKIFTKTYQIVGYPLPCVKEPMVSNSNSQSIVKLLHSSCIIVNTMVRNTTYFIP